MLERRNRIGELQQRAEHMAENIATLHERSQDLQAEQQTASALCAKQTQALRTVKSAMQEVSASKQHAAARLTALQEKLESADVRILACYYLAGG